MKSDSTSRLNVNFHTRDRFFAQVEKRIRPTEVVLDIGPGIRPQQFFTPKTHICVEPYLPYIRKLCESSSFPYFFMNCTWDVAMSLLPDKDVDTVFIIDVIEHLEKEQGVALLEESIRVARTQVIVFTPVGFFPQEYEEHDAVDRWGMNGTSWQTHRSGWDLSDFGESWELHVCKDFHKVDQHDKLLVEPWGAFMAIWNGGTPQAKEPVSIVRFLRFLKRCRAALLWHWQQSSLPYGK